MLDRLRCAITENRQRDVGDRPGHQLAISKQLVEIRVARLDEILPAAIDERHGGRFRDVEESQRVAESDRDRMRGMSAVAAIQLALPVIECSGGL